MRWAMLLTLGAVLCATAPRAEPAPADAFLQLMPGPAATLERGRLIFERNLGFADGVGPLFSRLSCDGCHTHAGRGEPPDAPEYPLISMVVRLSVPGRGPEGGPLPHPVYGEALERNAIPGVPIEGTATIAYTEKPGRYDDGTAYSLRTPTVRFSDLGYGPIGPLTLVSARVPTVLAGLGLIDRLPEAAILALAAEEARQGKVHGRPNRVWDVAARAPRIGRFGWKAGQPTLRQQNANAFNRDIGMTNVLYPENDCTAAETACRKAAAAAPHPKLREDDLDALTAFIAHLMPPPRLKPEDVVVRRGEAVFASAGCALCHRPTLGEGAQAFHPFSDLLLHDMGDGLADGRPEFEADGRSWRTPPLWGLGSLPAVNNHRFLLHDGRARGPAEAILWHGGEAAPAAAAFRSMTAADRAALIAFLESL